MTTQNNAPSGQESSQFTLGDSPDRRESTAASGVLPTTSSSSPGGVTYRPVKRSLRVCPSCGGKKAAHAVSCRACRTEQEQATKVALVCEQCSSPFLRPAGEHTKRMGRGAGNHTFCSAECSRAWRKVQAAQPHGSCANCSAPLVKRFQQHYCSPACYHAARPRPRYSDRSHRRPAATRARWPDSWSSGPRRRCAGRPPARRWFRSAKATDSRCAAACDPA